MSKRCLIAAVVSLGSAWFAGHPQAAANYCDEVVRRWAVSGQLGYQERGDRCEGFFARRRTEDLQVLSFGEPFQLNAWPKEVPIRWTAPEFATDVHLRLLSTSRAGQYYRMDSTRKARDSLYKWSTAFAVTVPPSGAAFLASASTALKTAPTILLPVSVGANEIRRHGPLEMKIVASVTTVRVVVTSTLLDNQGKPVSTAYENEKLSNGGTAERPITLILPNPAAAGLYKLEIGAFDQSGRALAMSPLVVYLTR